MEFILSLDRVIARLFKGGTNVPSKLVRKLSQAPATSPWNFQCLTRCSQCHQIPISQDFGNW